jgi:hypothetical protein
MPWRYRKFAILVFVAALMWAASITVLVRSKSLDLELLAAAGMVGGLAIIVTNLPNGGNNDKTS